MNTGGSLRGNDGGQVYYGLPIMGGADASGMNSGSGGGNSGMNGMMMDMHTTATTAAASAPTINNAGGHALAGGANSIDLAALLGSAGPASFQGIPTESALITLQCCLENGSVRLISLPLFTSFDQFANMLAEEFHQPVAFEYVDEEGERIAVKNDNDLVEMMSMYFFLQSNPSTAGPVTLHISKIPSKSKKNLLSLKVDVQPASASPSASQAQAQAQAQAHMQAQTQAQTYQHSDQYGTQQHIDPTNAHLANPSSVNDFVAENFSRVRVVHEELQFVSTLGHGASGTVHKVVHAPTGSILALKTIPLDVNIQLQASAKQILTELDVLYKCEHPNIITFYGAYHRDHCIYMCMEFMDGGSLENMYRFIGSIPEPVLGKIIVSVVNGLVYLYNQFQIVHRDVKPSNILVNTRGEIKLCDFGVSGKLDNSIAKTFVGTNAYMAPERIKGHPYSVRSDVWSLGVSILEMALGRFPYPQDINATSSRQLSAFELLYCIVEEPAPRLPDESFSPELVDFVNHCLIKQQDQRPSPVQLQAHPLYIRHATENVNIAPWIQSALEYMRLPRRT